MCGWLELVWLRPGLRYWLGSMFKRLFVILYMLMLTFMSNIVGRYGIGSRTAYTREPGLDYFEVSTFSFE